MNKSISTNISENSYESHQSFDESCIDENELAVININIGDIYVTQNREILSAHLGSSIAICAYEKTAGVGGMGIILLPENNNHTIDEKNILDLYGEFIMSHLFNKFFELDAKKENIEIKIFGGNQLEPNTPNKNKENIEFIKNYISTEGYAITASSTEKKQPTLLQYFPYSGRARIKETTEPKRIAESEQYHRRSIEKQLAANHFELFKMD